MITAGIDVGSSAVKVAIVDGEQIVALHAERIRRRDLRKVIADAYRIALENANTREDDVAYVATTGEGELVEFRRGHFYGMTTHARGAIHLMPSARAALDIGALHARAMKIDDRSRVLVYRMTSQCASGSGQFLENVARYLGIAVDDVGPLSLEGTSPEVVSSICAVLAETDVINMVSRGIKPADIIKGIHVSMAGRYVKLLRAIGIDGDVAMTGGLASDVGLAAAIREAMPGVNVLTHPSSAHAGAIGAALWGAYRHDVITRRKLA